MSITKRTADINWSDFRRCWAVWFVREEEGAEPYCLFVVSYPTEDDAIAAGILWEDDGVLPTFDPPPPPLPPPPGYSRRQWERECALD